MFCYRLITISLLVKFRLNVVDSISYSCDTSGILIRNLDSEYALELHEKFNCIE